MGKYYFSCLFLFFISCNNGSRIGDDNLFKSRIDLVEKQYMLSDSTAKLIISSKVMRAYYSVLKDDTGFICRTLDLKTYFLPDYTYQNQGKRIPIENVSPSSDIYSYKDSIYEYDTESKYLYNLLNKDEPRGKLYTLKGSDKYIPTMPYSAQLVEYQNRPVFLYNYQLKKTNRVNYFDTSVFIAVIDSFNTVRVGKYPAILHKQKSEFTETYYCIDRANNIYYTHSGYDSIYKIDINGRILKRNVLHDFPTRVRYNPKKPGDLAYSRKYEASNEKNCRIVVCFNKYIIVLKKLAEPNLLEPPKYKYFVYNTDLEKLHCDTIRHNIIPVILPTKDGFLIFQKEFKYLYHYVLP
jgi:hypothetical protein